MDRVTKFAHFFPVNRIPVNRKYLLDKLVSLYIKKIIQYHEMSISIISNRDIIFTSIKFSTIFYPQTNDQFEKIIQNLEELLKPCAKTLIEVGI